MLGSLDHFAYLKSNMRLLSLDSRVPWTARSNQPILKEINPEHSMEGLMPKLQYVCRLMWRADSLEKTEKIEGKRRGRQKMKWLDSISNSMDMNLSKLRKIVKDRGAWRAAVHGVAKCRTQFGEWTTKSLAPFLFGCYVILKFSSFFPWLLSSSGKY